jgi:hypothetical protein
MNGNNMTFSGTGNVGIGTGSPTQILHIAGGNGIKIQQDLSDAASSWTYLWMNAGSVDSQQFRFVGFKEGGNSDLRLWNNANDDVMTWKQSGFIGIGTTTPAVNLDIVGDASGTLRLTRDANTLQWVQMGAGGGVFNIYSQGNTVFGHHRWYQQTASETRLGASLDADGNLGIGIASGDADARIHAITSAGELARFETTGTNPYISLFDTNGRVGYIQGLSGIGVRFGSDLLNGSFEFLLLDGANPNISTIYDTAGWLFPGGQLIGNDGSTKGFNNYGYFPEASS